MGDVDGAFTIDPCQSSVVVSHGHCVVGAPTAFGSVTVVIDPDSAATVSVLNSAFLIAASLVLLGSGAFLIRFARRREEG